MEKRLGPFPSTPDGAPAPTLGERSGAPSGLRPSSFVICNTPVEVQFTSAGCLNYPCRTPLRSEPIAVWGKRRVPLPLQNLHRRLLDEAIQYGWDAKLSHPSSIRLRDFHPPHRFRFVGPVQQLFPNSWPVLLQIVAELIDRHPVDAGATFIAPHLPQCFLQVCSLTYFLHHSNRVVWTFGLIHHRERFDVFP